MRNSLAREFSREASRSTGLSKLEKENREDRLASKIMKALTDSGDAEICGVKIENVTFTKSGCHVFLADRTSLKITIKLVDV